jgi:hypothetical protein
LVVASHPLFPPSLEITNLLSVSMDLPVPETSCKGGHLWLAWFTYVYKTYPYHSTCSISLFCVVIPHFIMDIWGISTSGLFWLLLQHTHTQVPVCDHTYSFHPLRCTSRSKILSHTGTSSFLLCFETGSHYVTQAGLASGLHLLNAGITVAHLLTQLTHGVLMKGWLPFFCSMTLT